MTNRVDKVQLGPEMTEILTVRLSPAIFRRLRLVAENDGRNMSNMARQFIIEGCDRRDEYTHKRRTHG